ncbi:spore germination protein [Desulfosporosinus sp.]|uniref:spore germination protein n=1 Tax=Desulfosporosinus sp. TaxID=157907 RepID=UPI0025B81517|nr:spore germination protein [Desulfosporosinus sp.]MBC2728777.1 spore germination protein [Desulfosporosinus sp.]
MFNFWKKNNTRPVNKDISFQRIDLRRSAEESNSDSSEDNGSKSKRSKPKNNLEGFPIVSAITRDKDQLLRGSKLRFTEDAQYNLQILKDLVPTSELIAETILLGNLAPKEVLIVYIGNIANLSIVAEVKRRIKTIKAKTLYESSYIQRNIEDSTLSPFPQVEATERPDVAVSALFQGRIIIILDGSPNTLLAPCTFFDLMDTPDDAYTRWFITASFFRVARYVMLLLAGCLPGFYIALLSYNPEMLPTRILLLILNSREGTPFPIYFEVFLMMGIAEALRMMLLRVPSLLGSTVALFCGITLVISGIFSNIIGPGLVIVVTLTFLASFGIPDYDLRSSIRIIQFVTMIISSFLGLFGFALSFFLICIHLSTLKSFGIPYMAPLATLEIDAWGHTLLRGNSKEMPIDDTYKPQDPR